MSEDAGRLHNRGLRVYGGRAEPFHIPWPELAEFPSFGLVRKRADFDELLANHAVGKGATLYQQANVNGAVIDDRSGRITGVTTKDGRTFRAPIVAAADGNLPGGQGDGSAEERQAPDGRRLPHLLHLAAA